MKRLQGIGFSLFMLLTTPIWLTGLVWIKLHIRFLRSKSGVATTAYTPLMYRYMAHRLGKRVDFACARIFNHLPGMPSLVIWMTFEPLFAAISLFQVVPRWMRYPPRLPTNIANALHQRTHFCDEQALAAIAGGVKQMVFLGAGWDTRPYLLARQPQIKTFEIDTPDMQTIKRESIKSANIWTQHVTFVPVDFTHENWFDRLLESGFDPELPTFFLWEGVTYYLPEEAVLNTLANIQDGCSDATLLFDYFTQSVVDKTHSKHLTRIQAYLQRIKEAWVFGLPDGEQPEGVAKEWLAEHGYELAAYEAFGKPVKGKCFGGVLTARVTKEKPREEASL